MNALLATILLLTPSGLDLFGHHRPSGPCCDACGTEVLRVQALIGTLQGHPNWRERDDAAHALRKFDARCHPEIGSALAAAMLCDRHEEVREEAAEALAKLAPCQPDVHAALVRAADCDPDHATRKWARRALRNLDDECVEPCTACGTIAAPVPTRFIAPILPATIAPPGGVPLEAPYGGPGTVVVPAEPVPPIGGYVLPPETVVEPPYGVEPAPASPLDALPPVEVAPPELPPSPSPFLPGASREDGEDADADELPLRRASNRREPVLIRFGQRLFGDGR
jgi:hypothetical protein